MTNGEKFKEVFKLSQVEEGELYAFAWLPNHDAAEISIDWWNAEYKEPTTKTCKTCRNYGSHNGVCDICKDYNCFTEPNKSEIPNSSTTKNDLGVDCIDRAEVLKLMQDNWHTHNGDWAMQESMDDIRALPAVTPQEPKTGHWNEIPKYKDIAWRCSECEHFTTMKRNFCPNCGADMRKVEE